MSDPIQFPEFGGSRPKEVDPRQMRNYNPPAPDKGESFQDVLTGAVSEVTRLQNEADQTIKELVAGEITDVTEAMVALERADVSFQTMMAVRNKIVQAYEEVMRMQV